MPFKATVFNVLIASPGDVDLERNIVREVVYEWNAIHSSATGIVFQPVGWETHSHPSMGDRAQGVLNEQILKDADLLVAIFWTRLGTPTGEAASGSVEEIERHVQAGKPAMVYFSSAPVRRDSVSDEQWHSLQEYKKNCKGLLGEYENPTEFRQLFARHLASWIHNELAKDTPAARATIVPDREVPSLNKEAKALLAAAAGDRHGNVLRLKLLSGVEIQTGGKQFVERGNPRSEATWESALEQLVGYGLLRASGNDRSFGEVYRVTTAGYEMATVLRN